MEVISMAKTKAQKRKDLKNNIARYNEMINSKTYAEWVDFDLMSEDAKLTMRKEWEDYYQRVREYWIPLLSIMKDFLFRKDVSGLNKFTLEAEKAAPNFHMPTVPDVISYTSDQSLHKFLSKVKKLRYHIDDLCDDLAIENVEDYIQMVISEIKVKNNPEKKGFI